jgi:RecA-family ATPase
MTQNSTSLSWVKTAKDIIDLKIEKVPMLVDPLFQKYGVVSLAGSSDLGKSYLLLQLASEIVNGSKTFLDFEMNTSHNSVIYLSTEDDEYSLCPRLLKLSKSRSDLSVYHNLRVLVESTDLLKRLNKLLIIKPADLVIIDTFADIFGGDMNQSNKVRTYIQEFKNLAVKHKTLFIFNHHCSKRNDARAPHKDNLLGSQGFESSMRSVIELRQDFKRTRVRHLCIVKGNHIDDSFKNASFELEYSFENGFSNTGNRVKFEKLVRPVTANESKKELEGRVGELKELGLSITKITQILNNEGYKVSRATVGEICKKNHPSIQFPKGDKTDGQAVVVKFE